MDEEKPPLTETQDAAPMEISADEYKDKYLRLLAEIDNTRKRMQKEKQEMIRFAVDSVLSDLLAPIDNLESALQFAEQMSPEVQNWAKGFQMILGQFKEVLSEQGVTPFASEGELFDPIRHYAIETEETNDVAEGTILQEFVKGYASKERVLRPARVKVAMPTKDKELKKEGE